MSQGYDDLIMDHIKNARNFRAPADSDRSAHGVNPLCGDELTVYVKLEGDTITDAAFQCTCCGVSMASASIMTELVKGRASAEVRTLLREFIELARENGTAPGASTGPEASALYDTVTR